MAILGNQYEFEDERTLVVSKEKNRDHRGKNLDKNLVCQYKLDGKVFQNETSCDFLLLNREKKTAYFIELKGRNIEHAIKQLEDSYEKLKEELQDHQVNFRIVASNIGKPALQSMKYKRFSYCHEGRIKMKTTSMEENI